MVKSILKINANLKQSSSRMTTTTTKNVRFDLLSTTVKRFDSNDEPITISNDYHYSSCSPDIDANSSITTDIYNQRDNITDEPCWFNNLDVLPNLINFDKKFHSLYQRYKMTRSNSFLSSSNQFRNFYKQNDSSLSDLDYDDDITIDTLDNSRFTGLDPLDKDTTNGGCLDTDTDNNDFLISDSDIKWELVDSNVPKTSQSLDLLNDQSIQSFLNGQNIKLYKLEPLKGNKIYGSLIVNNIDFEKIIEVKFTFNHWSNIHYINSSYCKSLTPRFDQFQFVIDLNRYKFFLQIKNLLNKQIIIEFYCRYDVGNQTYFDNNNYSNYTLTLLKTESSDPEKNNNVTTPHVGSSPFEHTTDLSLSSSSSSLSKSECVDSQHSPKDNAPPHKNNDNCIDSYVSNSRDTNPFNEGGRKISAGTTTTRTNNRQYNHPFLVNNKYVVPMTSKQFMNNRNIGHTRTFSEDTDYYNTSPLKHLYHNDTCQFIKKPATKNEVLNIEPNPLPLLDPSISTTTTSTTTKFELQSNDVTNRSLSSETNRLKFSEEKPKQSGNLPDLTDRLENKIFSTPSLSSTSSTISFQINRLNAKKKNLSSLSSTILPTGSVTIPNTNTNSNNNIKLNSTNLKENEPETVIDNVDHISNFISGQNSGLSSNPPLTGGGAKDLPHIGKPTLGHFNNDSTVRSISLGYKPELERQNKVQSKRTDTIFKSYSITFNNNSHRDKSDNLIIPKSKSVSSLDNLATVHGINNSKSFNSLVDISNSNIKLSNRTHDNSSTKKIQNNPLKSMDYQTLLQCYCFYTSPPSSNRDSVPCYSEIGLSSSPGATLFL